MKVEDVINYEESLAVKLEDEFDNGILDDDSSSTEKVIASHERIESLKYQNKINIQRLRNIEWEDNYFRKKLIEN